MKQQNDRHFHALKERILALALIWALALCLIPAAGRAEAQAFTYSDAEQARKLALDCLMICGFSQEFDANGSEGSETKLTRWEDTITIYVSGSPSEQDLAELDEFIMECATHCPNMPNIRVVSEENNANVSVWYGPLDQLKDHSAFYIEGNWGFFSYWYNGYRMYRAEIVIATDVNTQESKNHLLREELTGAFGLTNDHFLYSDSILYGEWTTTQEFSDVDWLMLNMLYDPDLQPGMSAGEARPILEQKIAR